MSARWGAMAGFEISGTRKGISEVPAVGAWNGWAVEGTATMSKMAHLGRIRTVRFRGTFGRELPRGLGRRTKLVQSGAKPSVAVDGFRSGFGGSC